MKAADLREKSVEDLTELRKALARDVFQNRLKNFTNRLDDTSSIRKARRDLARVITLLNQRKPAAAAATATAPAAAAAPAEAAPKKTKKVEAAPEGSASEAKPATKSKKASAKKGEAKSQ
jgi:large subunit ribosomal protein L29